jgi:hypothetical protein
MQPEVVKLTEAGEFQSCAACGIAPHNVGFPGNLDIRLRQGKLELNSPTLLQNLRGLDRHAAFAQVKQKAGDVRRFREVDQGLDWNA